MKPKPLTSIDLARAWGQLAQIARNADRLFVTSAGRIEEGFLTAAEGVSLTAVSIIPALSAVAVQLATRLGKRTERLAQEKPDSVFYASVPAAAYRTAAIMELLGEESSRWAARALTSLVAGARPPGERAEEHYRAIGRSVATLVNEGLDVWPLSLSIREHVRAIRNLKRR